MIAALFSHSRSLKLVGIFGSILISVSSCSKSKSGESGSGGRVNAIHMETISNDSISIRALIAEGDKVWFAGSFGTYGNIDTHTSEFYSSLVRTDSLQPEFRSIAQTSEFVFIMSAGSPALIYRINKDGSGSRLVYSETGEKVFYDSLHFSSDTEGIAMGDPQSGCMSVLRTVDGGLSWHKIPCDKVPGAEEGEAGFAASNSVLACQDGNWWMATGGRRARVYHSGNKGGNWTVAETPIIQGKPMTGVFSMDFYDGKRGMIAGGDYEDKESNRANKAVTSDGGKTWKLVGDGSGPGYVSCLQYVPNSNAMQILTVGATGIHYSADAGNSWKKMSDERQLYTIRFANDSTAYAAGKNKIMRLRLR